MNEEEAKALAATRWRALERMLDTRRGEVKMTANAFGIQIVAIQPGWLQAVRVNGFSLADAVDKLEAVWGNKEAAKFE